MGASFFYSAVYGYRPPFLRPTIRSPTSASLSKLSASTPRAGLHHGFEMVASGGDSILVGPSALLLYKQYGLEAGLLVSRLPADEFPARREVSLRCQLQLLFLAQVEHEQHT